MFDENSFEQNSFSAASWLFDTVARIFKRISQFFVTTFVSETHVITEEKETWINKQKS